MKSITIQINFNKLKYSLNIKIRIWSINKCLKANNDVWIALVNQLKMLD